MDVYVDRSNRVWLIDFGPLGPPADPLLFETWETVEEVNPLYTIYIQSHMLPFLSMCMSVLVTT